MLNVGVPAEFNSRTPEPANQGLQDAIKCFSGLELNSAGDGPPVSTIPCIRMISEGSSDSEDWRNDSWNFSFL